MSRNIKIIIILIILVLIITLNIANKNQTSNLEINENSIAIMIETEPNSGNYVKTYTNKWPSNEEGYILNTQLSSCAKEGNLDYNRETNSVILTSKTGNNCSLFFSKETVGQRCADKQLSNCIIDNYKIDNSIIYHNLSSAEELGFTNYNLVADDNSYRFTGPNPNNFVCLDGKEETGSCTSIEDLYRIIGVFQYNGEYYTKLIKYDYVKGSMAGSSGQGSYWGHYPYYGGSYKEGDTSEIISFYWNNKTLTNSYAESNLFTDNLNTYFYNNLIDKDDKLKDYIVNMPVYNKGCPSTNYLNYSAKAIYDEEKTDVSLASYNISLMNLSDYLYAASSEYWTYSDASFYSNSQKENWLFMGEHEWIFDAVSDTTDQVYFLNFKGAIYPTFVASYNAIVAIRPTLYLNSNAKILNGIGSKENPIRIK